MKKQTVTKAKAKHTKKQVRAKVSKDTKPTPTPVSAPETKTANPLAPEVGSDLFKKCNFICTRVHNAYECYSFKEFEHAADMARIPRDVFKAFFDEWIIGIVKFGFSSPIVPNVYPWPMWQKNK